MEYFYDWNLKKFTFIEALCLSGKICLNKNSRWERVGQTIDKSLKKTNSLNDRTDKFLNPVLHEKLKDMFNADGLLSILEEFHNKNSLLEICFIKIWQQQASFTGWDFSLQCDS